MFLQLPQRGVSAPCTGPSIQYFAQGFCSVTGSINRCVHKNFRRRRIRWNRHLSWFDDSGLWSPAMRLKSVFASNRLPPVIAHSLEFFMWIYSRPTVYLLPCVNFLRTFSNFSHLTEFYAVICCETARFLSLLFSFRMDRKSFSCISACRIGYQFYTRFAIETVNAPNLALRRSHSPI